MDSLSQNVKCDISSIPIDVRSEKSITDKILNVNSSGSSYEQAKALKEKSLVLCRNSDGLYCCPACAKTFASRSATFRHYRKHIVGEHPYMCSFCQKKFASKASVDAHQLRVHNLNTGSALSCSECGKLFMKRSALEVHLKIHSPNKPFHCEQCGKSFTQKIALDIHIAKHAGKYDYQCSVCQKAFVSQAKLNDHSFVHKTPRFTCDLCGHGFVRHDTLKIHQRTHTGERPFQCSVCSCAFLSQTKLLVHIQNHNEEYHYKCPMCNAQFKQKTGLVTHSRRMHRIKQADSAPDNKASQGVTHMSTNLFTPSSAANITMPDETMQKGQTASETSSKKCFLCPHCGKKFRKRQSLREHEQMHEKSQGATSQLHMCNLCPKSFVHKSKLTAHIRTHLQEPPYTCNICGKQFHRKDVYNHHMFLHTNERPFSCAECGKAFASKFNLSAHLNTHSASSKTTQPTVELQCDDCGKKFKHKKTYVLHRKTHVGDFTHSCVTCGKKFMKKSHFEGHMRSHATDRPFLCPTCGRRFKERKHCREHARKAHPSTFSLASLFASITNEDAQIDHMADILCPSEPSTALKDNSSGLSVTSLPNQLPSLVDVSNAAAVTATTNLDTGYLLSSQVNINETSISMSTPMPNMVFSTLEPMLPDIHIPNTTQFLMATSGQSSLEKNTSCQVELSVVNTMSLTILSGEDTSSVLSQGLEP